MTAATITDTRTEPSRGDRQRMLEAASELLANQGLAALTVDAVAERTGASRTTLGRWWPSEDALALDTLRHAWVQVAAHVHRGAYQFGLL